jgi:sugar transferase (PEP-CTERM/EpsH1 system associated)
LDVVFLSQRVPYPPDRGDRITTYHVLRHLARRGARIRVGCLAESTADLEAAAALPGVVDAVDEVAAVRIHGRLRRLTSLRALLTGEPISLPYFRPRPLVGAVDRWMAAKQPDLVYMYSGYMAQLVLRHDRPARLMQFAELDSDKWRQFARRGGAAARSIYGREARLLLDFERRVARSFDAALVVSEVEKQLFMQCIPGVEPRVVPNGVDVDHFASAGDAHRNPRGVLFTGVMDYEPNVDGVVWFARECWPQVRARFPDARFTIVGSRPVRAVRDLASHAGIEVTGRVPQTPPYFDRAAVAVAPLRLARGVQNKVLEAMSMGVAVVASPQAAQGLGTVPAEALWLADGAPPTVEAVCALLGDPARARAMGRAAAAWIRAHYRWDQVLAHFDAAIEAALAAAAARRGAAPTRRDRPCPTRRDLDDPI